MVTATSHQLSGRCRVAAERSHYTD